MNTNHPMFGTVLRCRTLTNRPYRADPKASGMVEETLTANPGGARDHVFTVLVLGHGSEREDTNDARTLLSAMRQMGFEPLPDHPILHVIAEEEERKRASHPELGTEQQRGRRAR